MKKLLVPVLALVMLLSLAGCGSKEQTKELAGTWRCGVDVSEQVNAAILGELTEAVPTIDTALPVYLCFTVTADGAYTLALDYAATEEAMAAYFDALTPALTELVYAQAEEDGMTREDYDAALEALDLTAEAYISAALDAVDVESLISAMTGAEEAAIAGGVCRAIEGKLYLADSADALEEAGHIAYTAEADTMVWTDEDGAVFSALTEEEQSLLTFPLTWTR